MYHQASARRSFAIADATARNLLGAVLSSAATLPGVLSGPITSTLSNLCVSDPEFAAWLVTLDDEPPYLQACPRPGSERNLPDDKPTPVPSVESEALDNPPGASSEPGFEVDDVRLSLLVGWLPEYLLRNFARLAIRDSQTSLHLRDAVHLAVRARAQTNSDQLRLEEAKREALYHVAYGLSHELNNPLANISARAGVLLQKSQNQVDSEMLQTIIDNAMRGCEMLGDLMLVARPPALEFREINAETFLDNFVSDARTWTSRWGLRLSSDITVEGSQLHADASALREALWCLVRNALEASSREADEIRLISQVTLKHSLSIAIEDDGAGLSAEALRSCFDPYFSGREAGRGLGLGLTKAMRIIDLHHGTLTLKNIPTGGCCALVEIPLNGQNLADMSP